MNINYGTTEVGINIDAVEKHYGVKYIGDFCLKNRDGGWCEFPTAIFYQANPNIELGHSNYLGVFVRQNDNAIMLTNGASAFDDPITGVVANDGEIIYSRYRHDFRTSTDGTAFVDGGRDYVRRNIVSKTVTLVIDKDKLVVQD